MGKIFRFITLMTICAAAESVAMAQGLLTLDRGQVYEMARDDGRWAARVYVTPKAQSAARITVTLPGAARGTQADPALSSAFMPPRRVAENGAITAFDIITRDATLPRGTYDLLLVASDEGVTTQPVSLQVTIPAAIVKQPGALLVTRVLPLFGPAEDFAPPLVLAETGQKSPASLLISQQDQFTDSTGTFGGQLQFRREVVQPGQIDTIRYQIQGDFPLGSSRANLSISAPEIESPLSIAVEVRTRRSRWVLLILIVVGLGFGYLMRTVLQQRILFDEARRKALDLCKRLERERGDVPDSIFRARIERAVKTLLSVVQESRVDKTSDVTDAVAAAEKSLAEAQTDLQQRSKTVADELKDLALIVKTSWRLPKRMLDQFASAAKALEDAQELNKNSDAAGAQQMLDSTRDALKGSVEAFAAGWKQDLTGLTAALRRAEKVLLPDDREAFRGDISRLLSSSEQIPEHLEDGSPQALKTLLTALDKALQITNRLLSEVRAGADSTFQAIKGALEEVHQQLVPQWKGAEEATDDFSEWLRSVEGEGNVKTLDQKINELKGAWGKAFEAQGADSAVMKLVSAGDYIAAVHELPTQESMQGDEATTEVSILGVSRIAAATRSLPVEAPSEPVLFESFYPVKRSPITVEILEANTLRELFAARWLLTILSAVGLAIVGYLLFADKFVGTSGDLMTAFFWGFTTDVGLNALISAATRKTAP
jgi:hypothetical protein